MKIMNPIMVSNQQPFKELLRYCILHQDEILVRFILHGRKDSYPISRLPFKSVLNMIKFWHDVGHLPRLAPDVTKISSEEL
jgi:hypothetical protein